LQLIHTFELLHTSLETKNMMYDLSGHILTAWLLGHMGTSRICHSSCGILSQLYRFYCITETKSLPLDAFLNKKVHKMQFWRGLYQSTPDRAVGAYSTPQIP